MFLFLSMLLTCICLYCVVWVLSKPAVQTTLFNNKSVSNNFFIRCLWPWVYVLRPFCEPFISWRLRAKLTGQIQRAGLAGPWSAAYLVAMQVVLALGGFGLVSAVLLWLLEWSIISSAVTAIMFALFFAWLPYQHVIALVRLRQQHMLRELPFLLDMTTLCVEAGLNLHGSLQQAVAYGPAGPMRFELNHALTDIRAGVAKIDALKQMAQRTGLPEIMHLVSSLAQADQMGSGLGPLLRAQSDQRRSERFLRAEEQALKAPVKMLFPMVFCIFPCTFLIIGFPIFSSLVSGIN